MTIAFVAVYTYIHTIYPYLDAHLYNCKYTNAKRYDSDAVAHPLKCLNLSVGGVVKATERITTITTTTKATIVVARVLVRTRELRVMSCSDRAPYSVYPNFYFVLLCYFVSFGVPASAFRLLNAM